MLKKFFVTTLLFATTFLFVTAPYAKAQTRPGDPGNWWFPSFDQFTTKVQQGDPNQIFGERYTHAQVAWIMYSFADIILGTVSTCISAGNDNPVTCLTTLSQTGQLPGGSPVLAFASFSDKMLSTKPVSGVAWTTNLASKLSIIPVANAQTPGAGFRALTLADPVWRASRDFSYALMTLAIIILAFMIMFRVKLSPQVTISIQSALPKVAIGLVLITFSYAIAGFIVDLAYIAQGLFALMFTTGHLSSATALDLFKQMQDGTSSILDLGIAYILVGFSGPLYAAVITGGAGIGAGIEIGFGGFIVGLFILIVFIVAALWLFWVLLKAYVTTILLVIIAPFYILAGVVSPAIGFTGWLKQFIANVAVFPTVTMVIFLAHFFFWSNGFIGCAMGGGAGAAALFINPFHIQTIGTCPAAAQATATDFPGFGGGLVNTGFIAFAASLVLVVLAGSIANQVKTFIATGRAGRFEGGLGAAGVVAGTGLAGYEAYRAPQKAAFEQQVKDELATGGLMRGTRRQMQISQGLNAVSNPLKKFLK